MQKTFIVTTLLFSTLMAENHLGKLISNSSAQESIIQNSQPIKTISKTHLKTRITPKKVKESFKKDHHRYDKRYRNFNYKRDGYYNNDGYYYGYYDNSGYFYDNIFYTYNSIYTYHDRCNRRGHFRRYRHHLRPYIHHLNNNWNKVHRYREPNHIVYGHYYEPTHHYSTRYRSNYNSSYRYHDNARMHVTQTNREHRYTYSNRRNNTQYYDRYRSRPIKSTARMTTRISSGKQLYKNITHMSVGK